MTQPMPIKKKSAAVPRADAATTSAPVRDPVNSAALAAHRNDSWYNQKSRFGGRADPVISTVFIRNRSRMDRETAEALYELAWLPAKIVNKKPRDATRTWIDFKHKTTPAKAEKLRDLDRKMNGRGKFREAATWGRLHGGNLLCIGAVDGRAPEEPLELENVTEVLWANNVDRWLCFPLHWESNPDAADFGLVDQYRVQRLSLAGVDSRVIHATRTLKFEGNDLPYQARIRNWGWGASVLERVFDELRDWGVSNQAAAAVIPSFITTVMKISNLQQLIANGEWDTIRERLGELVSQMAIQNVAFYGGDEEIRREGMPVTGLADLIDRFMTIVSGAAEYPKSILFHAESGSLGGTAAGIDVRNYYAEVQAYQENDLRPLIRSWLDIIGMTIGLEPGEVDFEFNPLWQLTELETAQIYNQTAQGDNSYIQNGMVDAPERLAVYRWGGKKFNSAPPVLDTSRQEEFIEQLDAQPVELTPPEGEDGQGAQPGGQE